MDDRNTLIYHCDGPTYEEKDKPWTNTPHHTQNGVKPWSIFSPNDVYSPENSKCTHPGAQWCSHKHTLTHAHTHTHVQSYSPATARSHAHMLPPTPADALNNPARPCAWFNILSTFFFQIPIDTLNAVSSLIQGFTRGFANAPYRRTRSIMGGRTSRRWQMLFRFYRRQCGRRRMSSALMFMACIPAQISRTTMRLYRYI